MNTKNKYYNNPPEFDKLALIYPDFAKYVYQNKYGTYSIDWKNKNAVKELCRTLLDHDFGLSYWEIPDGFLIPSITSRCNYIHWIHDILEESGILENKIIGLDIGTGANCIYPILGNKIYDWNFKAVDINKESLAIAEKIIGNNSLSESIQFTSQCNEENVFENVIDLTKEFFHFSMCNPPYFDIDDEEKHDNPNTVKKLF